MPRGLARPLFGLAIALTVAEHFVIPGMTRLRDYEIPSVIVDHAGLINMVFSATELALVGTILFVHFTCFDRGT